MSGEVETGTASETGATSETGDVVSGAIEVICTVVLDTSCVDLCVEAGDPVDLCEEGCQVDLCEEIEVTGVTGVTSETGDMLSGEGGTGVALSGVVVS